MRLVFEQIRTGGDRNFAYLFGDRVRKEAAIIDPSYDPAKVVGRAQAQGLTVRYIICTHSHPDHTNGNEEAQSLCAAPIAAFRSSPIRPQLALEDDQLLPIGDFSLRVLHTPGHCDDHIVLYNAEHQLVITGDLIFVGKVGGTQTAAQTRTEFESIQRVLQEVPAPTTLWPGHDYGCRPSSTIALEKAVNPFVMAANLEEFETVKATWPQFKQSLGLF
ncbi:MAG: hydroxyacylglutathione hydrolase family protein [Planctomycetota bacterium]